MAATAAQNLFSSFDDALFNQIQATHSKDAIKVDETPLLNLIKDILERATPMIPQTHMEPVVEDTAHPPAAVGMLKELANTIHRISCEMTCKCTSGGDAEATLALFGILSSYSWGAKVVLVLAAFAMNYGEFSLIAQLHTGNPLAKSVSLLKQLPDIIEHPDIYKQRFDAINNLIEAMLVVTNCIVEFEKVPSEYLSHSDQYKLVAIRDIPISAYWTITSVVACATRITTLIGGGPGYISSTIDLAELSNKVVNIRGHLAEQLELCRQHITYQKLVALLRTVHRDNTKILRELLCSKDDRPLVYGTTKERVGLDSLRSKTVMFFISDLDGFQEELEFLVQIFTKTQQERPERNFEIVWLPVLDRHLPWSSASKETYNGLATKMPWYLLHDPLQVNGGVIKYIRDVWCFENTPILVVLDPQGKLVCPNAMWIWDTPDFSFPIDHDTIWKKQTWQLEFLINKIDREKLPTMGEDHYVCLYGGEDVSWIRKLIPALNKLAEKANITLEMVYVGKSKQKKRARKEILEEIDSNEKIRSQKLRGYWQEQEVRIFWARLESMWHFKRHQGKTIENDPIMQEVTTMLCFNGSDEGWALISQRSGEMVEARGEKLIKWLENIDKWKPEKKGGLIQALKKELTSNTTDEHCTCLILHGNTGTIRELLVCNVCKHPMERSILYCCCK